MNNKIKECYDAEFMLGYNCTMETIKYLQPFIVEKLNMRNIFTNRCFFYEINDVPNFKMVPDSSIFIKPEDYEYSFPTQKSSYLNEDSCTTIHTQFQYKKEDKVYDYFTIIFHYSQFLKEFKTLNNFNYGPLSYECLERAIRLVIYELMMIKLVHSENGLFEEDEFRNKIYTEVSDDREKLKKYICDTNSELSKMIYDETTNFLETHCEYISSSISALLDKRINFYLYTTNVNNENMWYTRDLDSLDR